MVELYTANQVTLQGESQMVELYTANQATLPGES